MYKIKNKLIVLLSVLITLISGCKDLDELNINPNMISELFNIMIDEMVETEISEFRNDGKF